MSMEYRTWITVADMPVENEALWLPLIERLEHDEPELGPVVSWVDERTMQVVFALDGDSRSAAATDAVTVLGEALRAVGLGDRFPAAIEVEPAGDFVTA